MSFCSKAYGTDVNGWLGLELNVGYLVSIDLRLHQSAVLSLPTGLFLFCLFYPLTLCLTG